MNIPMQLNLFEETILPTKDTRVCKQCGKLHTMDMYSVDYSRSGFVRTECKDCSKQNSRARYTAAKTAPPVSSNCDCCNVPFSSDRKHVLDHCHITGSFRGWICAACNTGLGNFSDDPVKVRLGLAYLEAHHEQH